jgi:DeoR/GlpR family transcriptional regulator of sugar metabolism
MKMIIGWDALAELIKEYGEVEGTKIFLEFVATHETIQRQVDELETKNG